MITMLTAIEALKAIQGGKGVMVRNYDPDDLDALVEISMEDFLEESEQEILEYIKSNYSDYQIWECKEYCICDVVFSDGAKLGGVKISLTSWDGVSNDDDIFYYCDTMKDVKALVNDTEFSNSDFYIKSYEYCQLV